MEDSRLDTQDEQVEVEKVELDEVAVVPEGPRPVWSGGLRLEKLIVTALLALALLVTAYAAHQCSTNPEMFSGVTQTLDAQKNSALALAATTTGASVAVSALPGDIGSPIANQLADLSGKVLIILAIIYLEKYLLSLFGTIGLYIASAGLAALIAWYWSPKGGWGRALGNLGIKVALLGLALATLVPVSAGMVGIVNDQYQASLHVEQTIQETQQQTEATAEEQAAEEPEPAEEKGFFEKIGEAIGGGIESLKTGVTGATDHLATQLTALIDAIAVSIVTSCLIPLAVIFLYAWLFRVLTGVDLSGRLSSAMEQSSGAVREAGSFARGVRESHQKKKPAKK